jgi:hypothetical protein
MVIICTISLSSKWAGILYFWVLYDSQRNQWFYLNSVTQLIFVMVQYGVLFEVRAEFLNIV